MIRFRPTHRRKIEELGHAVASTFRAHEYLQKEPIIGIREMQNHLGLTSPTVASILDRMTKLGIVRELAGYARNDTGENERRECQDGAGDPLT